MSTSFTRKRKTFPEANVLSDAGAGDFLTALVAFLQPVIREYVALPASDNDNDENCGIPVSPVVDFALIGCTVDHTGAEVINGLEGKNLLAALTAFVTAAVHATPEAHSKRENPPDAVDDQEASEIATAPEIPKEVTRSELETKTLIAARAHVFNKMPIRLLAFDKTGSNIQLIERNEIFSFIRDSVFGKIKLPEFQLAWAEAEALKDNEADVLSVKYRQNKMKKLLEEVVEQSVDYAILSHTWMRDSPGDITFQGWAKREHNPRGNIKIIKFCEVAAQKHDVTLGWIDTICINKDSSSELDESIRSMYNWYRGASVCITFLSDTADISNAHLDSWFTRGWTLQELLAPAHSVFYNENWKHLGSSSDAEIQSVIKTASGITTKELELSRSGTIEHIPLSRRMQMACGRQVTREEDTSYSLMGILGVDISIAYGEGASRAFFRLVRELFSTKKNVIDLINRSYNYGENLLPSSLESYRYRDDWWDYSNGGTSLDEYLPLDPIIPTHLGVRIPLLLAPGLVTDTVDDENYVAKGALSAKTSISLFFSTGERTRFHLLLCDKRLYTGDLTDMYAANRAALPDEVSNIYMAGIVNFGIDTSGHILLPKHCLALDLNWNGVLEGNFTPSGAVSIQSGTPYGFKLESKQGLKIPKAELEEHGMQLVSLYL